MLSVFASVFIVGLLAIVALIPVAKKIGWVDHPDARKQHAGAPPLIGGASIVLAFLAGMFMLQPQDAFVWPVIVSSCLIFVMGLVDDIKELPVRVRVIFIMVLSLLIMVLTGLFLRYLGNLLLFGELYLWWVGVPFTLIAILGVANGFNMLDGIDGLAASMALITLAAIIAFAYLHDIPSSRTHFLWVLTVALIPFLLCNLKLLPFEKIFLGDSGALFIGFFITWILICISQSPYQNTSELVWLKPENALWCAALPIMDTVYSMYRRKRAGLSFFDPDRGHIHHIFLDLGYTARQTLMILIVIATLFVLFGLFWEAFIGKGAFFAFFALYLIYTQLMKRARLAISTDK